MELVSSTTLPRTLDLFVCPHCRAPLYLSTIRPADGAEVARCEHCAREFPAYRGTIDFVDPGERETVEREHYNAQYRKWNADHSAAAFDPEEWAQRWHDPHWPECPALLERLGDLRGKLVLCLGNGSSVKELYFLTKGARLICTDLSIEGVMAARSRYDLSAFDGNISFHAVSAYAIPLPDASVDILYGFEFVHHLPDIPSFFAETLRVLKPGGRCVLFDHAYSPLWQAAKLTVFRPWMIFTHFLWGISPEDVRATYAGGYREERMGALVRQAGFMNEYFQRLSFFQYLFTNGIGSTFGWNRPMWWYRAPGRAGRILDTVLTQHIGVLRQSRIELVWGFEKP